MSYTELTVWTRGIIMDKEGRDIVNSVAASVSQDVSSLRMTLKGISAPGTAVKWVTPSLSGSIFADSRGYLFCNAFSARRH